MFASHTTTAASDVPSWAQKEKKWRGGGGGNGSRWAQLFVAARQRAKLAVEEPLNSKAAMPSSGATQEQEEEDM